jgi:hypothetical protein
VYFNVSESIPAAFFHPFSDISDGVVDVPFLQEKKVQITASKAGTRAYLELKAHIALLPWS